MLGMPTLFRQTNAPVLAYYSLEAKTRVFVDASPFGFRSGTSTGASDTSNCPIALGSISLSETNQKYGLILQLFSVVNIYTCISMGASSKLRGFLDICIMRHMKTILEIIIKGKFNIQL